MSRLFRVLTFGLASALMSVDGLAQDSLATDQSALKIMDPVRQLPDRIFEGDTVMIKLTAKGGVDQNYFFSGVLSEPDQPPRPNASAFHKYVTLDPTGDFRWFVSKNTVPAQVDSAIVSLLVVVQNDAVEQDSLTVPLLIYAHKQVDSVTPSPTSSPTELELRVVGDMGWNLVNEGDTLRAQLALVADGQLLVDGVKFTYEASESVGVEIDPSGAIFWAPDHEFVSRLGVTREIHLVFLAEDSLGTSRTAKTVITVFHSNRAPVVNNLPVFYVIQGSVNTLQLTSFKNQIYDPDDDPFVFVPVPSDMPQGASLSSNGLLSWKPSRSQFIRLQKNPVSIRFIVEDQPSKARATATLRIMASQMDLPPEITMIPTDTVYEIDEDEFLNINFYLSDPNGDQDVSTFDFIADDPSLEKTALRKNADTQYEFIWEPGYDFVKDPDKEKEVQIRFFAFDQARNSAETLVSIKVNDAKDLVKLDVENHGRYRDILVRTLNLIEHLDDNQKSLEKKLRKAKKGRKNRALVSASFGAVTGLSPIILEGDPQKVVSAVGGTTVVTMGTLEARDALGQSADDVSGLIKVNVDLRNKLQNEGDAFARRYKTRAMRRNESFAFDADKLKSTLNDPQLVRLQLDASWENPKEINERRLRQAFSDYRSSDD